MGITAACYRMIADLLQAFRASEKPNPTSINPQNACKLDDLMIRALTAVFGMENNGRIKKEKARKVVEKLGLIYGSGDGDRSGSFDLPGCGCDGDEVAVEEVLGGLEEEKGKKRGELLREAFRIFDEDGNGFIEAKELKRVLECLGLDNGWEMGEIEKMVEVVDLNLDGKVDFGEFELMMGETESS